MALLRRGLLLLILAGVLLDVEASNESPNIVFMILDDLGLNDLSITDPRIYSPNLEALYKKSLKLENYYVQATCTPSRAAIMTGLYPFHMGIQRGVFRPDDPRYLPLNVPLLPELLQQKGYQTAAIGKWHLGYCDWRAVPTSRGFHSFYGHYLGTSDFFRHERSYQSIVGHDWRENTEDSRADDGKYATNLFSNRAVKIIREHNGTVPLFLYLAHLAPHSPIQTMKKYEDLNRDSFTDKSDKYRMGKAAMVSAVDEGLGDIIQALKDKDMWENTLFIFSSDNGGAVDFGGSNYPYRGAKGTLYEGGTRSIGFIHGKQLDDGKFEGLFHATDWLPTLIKAADESSSYKDPDRPLDGIDQWDALKNHKSVRKEIVYNIDEKTGTSAFRDERYKIMFGRTGKKDGWFRHYLDMKKEINIGKLAKAEKIVGFPDPKKHGFQVFDLLSDPYEKKDISEDEPEIVKSLYEKLKKYESGLVPAFNPDPIEAANPANYGGVWTPSWCPDTNYRI